MRSVAAGYGVRLAAVQRWVARAKGRRLDRVDWEDRPSAPRKTRHTGAAMQRRILQIRRHLREHSVLGEYGAAAIHRELEARKATPCPSLRTIGRILQRWGALDGRRRTRRSPPPAGWYLPEVARGLAELDSFDTIEGLAIRGGTHLAVLTGISLHGGLPAAWPEASLSSRRVVERFQEHWRQFGLPAYAQFDNDNRFLGPKQHADTVGRVCRLCLSLGVTPVFVPPNEMGFQAAIESFNGRWQAKVWSRFVHRSLPALQSRSCQYLDAVRQRLAPRREAAPLRDDFPRNWQLDLQQHPQGTITYLRRTNDSGHASLLGRSFLVDHHWVHRLVRAEVDLDHHRIRFYALRRRAPTEQPLLHELTYHLPKRPFKE